LECKIILGSINFIHCNSWSNSNWWNWNSS